MHDIINHTLFTIGGDTPVLLIDLVTSVFGLACVVLAGRNSKYNFWIGYVYTALLFLMFWNKHLYASLILQPISLGINILGHYRWTHPKKDEVSSRDHKSLKVSMLTWPQRAVAVISVFVLAVLWGKLLSFLSAMKKWDCWIAWLLVNVTQLWLHLSVGHVFMPIVCGLYLVNGVVSLVNWYRLYSKKA